MNDFCGSEISTNRTWYSEKPFFTPCLEEFIFAWLPCGIFMLLVPFEWYNIRRSVDQDIPWDKMNLGKLILNAAMILLSVIELAIGLILRLNELFNCLTFPIEIWSSLIRSMAFITVVVFVLLNRKYGIHTSGCQFLFWLLYVTFSVLKIFFTDYGKERDCFWTGYKYINSLVSLCMAICILGLNCFADKRPRSVKYAQVENEIPETSASFLSRITYHWYDFMAWKGFRKPLTTKDLWHLPQQEQSTELLANFARVWSKNINSKNKQRIPKADYQCSSIVRPIIKSFAVTFAFGSLMKLFTDLLTFVHPQILRLIIGYVDKQTSEDPQPLWLGVSYAVLLFITASSQTFMLCQYFHRMFVVGLRIRTVLVGVIYGKALNINFASRKEFTTGEIVNLMAVDVQRFIDLTTYLNMIWSAPLQIGLALYFLWQQLGPSVLAGLAVMIILIPINAAIANRIKRFQVKQMKNKDERVKLMNEILNGIKVLKLNAWEPCFQKKILRVRDKEVATLRASAFLNAGTFLLMFCASFLVSLVTFATYVLIDENNILDSTKTFVSLSLFNVLNFPLSTLPVLITNMIQAGVSIERINRFLKSEEIVTDDVQRDGNDEFALRVRNGNFSWSTDSENVKSDQEFQLHDINLNVEKHKLCAIIGPVGSGKSSLIQALLGEMRKLSGEIFVNGSIAYVPQQAWILNASLRDNILFGLRYDEKLYWHVIKSCALSADIAMLPAGDLIEIGEKGINLSGGQKQRISLARAVYRDADIYLLDDPLSAVDAHVARHIFDHVIGPRGLLSHKTRFVVTHNTIFLPQADNLYILRDGVLKLGDSYKYLDQSGDGLVGSSQGHEDAEKLEELRELQDKKNENKIGDSSFEGEIKETSTKDKIKKIIEAENSEQGSVRLAVYRHYIRSVGLGLVVLTLFLMLIFQVFQVSSNLWLAYWSNDDSSKIDNTSRITYLGVYAGLGLTQAVASFLATLVLSLACVYSSRDLHATLLANVIRWPMELFDVTPLGRVLNRFSKDIDTVDNALPQNWRMFLMQAFALLGTVVVISLSTPEFLIVVLVIAPIYIFVQRIYVETSRQLIRLESVSRSPIYSHFDETLMGLSSIRAYEVEERFLKISNEKVDNNNRHQYPILIANRWLSIRLEMIGNLIIFFASLFAVLSGRLNSGLVGLSVGYALQITDTLKWLVRLSSDIEGNIVAVERLKEYSECKNEAVCHGVHCTLPSDWPSNGGIIFENLDLRYRENLDPIFKGLNLGIVGGQKVGIVGRTGAGKSSLTLALFRIVEASGGRILIDDINIAELDLQQLRSRLTVIPQDPVLFAGPLRLNLDPFGRKTDMEIWQALELSHLKDYVKTFSEGLDFRVSEGGENLSVGQRQLVCLARAILRKSKILVLDEATAAIDCETDEFIQETIREQFRDCTVLTIAHRLNIIMNYDLVIVLDKGIAIESGSPTELLENPTTVFHSMAKDAKLI